MKISEKQIMQLITSAHNLRTLMLKLGGYRESIKNISILIDSIDNQQSDELKEVE